MNTRIYDPNQLPLCICEHLFNKNRLCFQETRRPELWYPGDDDRGASYWCGLTQDAQGPDGEIVGPEFCQGPRTCCEPQEVRRPEA